MKNKEDITVNKVSSLRDMPTKPCKGDILLTVCFSLRIGLYS
jgi:hypothetical protein